MVLPCFKCGKKLESVFTGRELADNQCNDGMYFRTHGQYGSTVFDPMDGSYLEINICDECVKEGSDKGMVIESRARRPVICMGSVVGYETVTRGGVNFQWHLDHWRDECVVTEADVESWVAQGIPKSIVLSPFESAQDLLDYLRGEGRHQRGLRLVKPRDNV